MKRLTISTLIAGALAAPTVAKSASSELALTVKVLGAFPVCTVSPDTASIAVPSAKLAGFVPAHGWTASVTANGSNTVFKITIPAGKTALCEPSAGGDSMELRIHANVAVAKEGKADANARAKSGAANATEEKSAASYYEYAVDLSIPATPAYTLLGLTGDKAVHPTTPKEWVASIANGRDDNGKWQSGIAIDGSLYSLFYSNEERDPSVAAKTINPYRWLRRTTLSLATAQGTTETDKNIRYAVGVTSTLWDKGDPTLQDGLLKCLNPKLTEHEGTNAETAAANKPRNRVRLKKAVFTQSAKVKPMARVLLSDSMDTASDEDTLNIEKSSDRLEVLAAKAKERYEAVLREKRDPATDDGLNKIKSQCRGQARRDTWFLPSFKVGYGASRIQLAEGATGNRDNGSAWWATLAYGVAMNPFIFNTNRESDGYGIQFLLHARERRREQVELATLADATKKEKVNQNSRVYAARIRAGGENRLMTAEWSRTQKNPEARLAETLTRRSLGIEWKIGEGKWLVISGGGEGGQKDGKNIPFVYSGLRFGEAGKGSLDQ